VILDRSPPSLDGWADPRRTTPFSFACPPSSGPASASPLRSQDWVPLEKRGCGRRVLRSCGWAPSSVTRAQQAGWRPTPWAADTARPERRRCACSTSSGAGCTSRPSHPVPPESGGLDETVTLVAQVAAQLLFPSRAFDKRPCGPRRRQRGDTVRFYRPPLSQFGDPLSNAKRYFRHARNPRIHPRTEPTDRRTS
jgi:hypothetical protein